MASDASSGAPLAAAQARTSVAPHPPSLWRHRSFLLLWSGQAVSEVGSYVSTLVLPLLAVGTLHASTFAVAGLSVLGTLPFLLLALPAGVVVDRVRRRRLMLYCDLGRLVLFSSVPLAALLWRVTLVHLYVVAAGAGVLAVFFDVAYQSYLPTLVAPELLVDGNGKLGTAQSFAQFAGPSLGGALAGVVGAARAVTADAVSFAVSALSLLLIRAPESEPVPVFSASHSAERPTFRAAMAEGLGYVVHHPILRKVVACTATANLFAGALTALQVVYLVRELHARPGVVGLVLALAALGGVAGGLLAGRLTRWIGSARIIWLALLAPAPFTALLPLARPGAGVLLFSLGWGAFSFGSVVYNVSQLSYRQAVCPPELLGRLNASVRWVAWGALPLGQLTGGAVATAVGLRSTLWLCVLGGAMAPLWVVASPLRGLRDVPAT